MAISRKVRTYLRCLQTRLDVGFIVSIVPVVANIEALEHSEPSTVFDELKVPPATLEVLIATISRRLTPQPIKLRADIELTCYNPAGIDAIKRALRAGEAVSTETVPIKARLVAPPLYVLGSNATDKVSTSIISNVRSFMSFYSMPPLNG